MKYTIKEAKEYSKRNELDKWLQLFLRDDSYVHASPNIPLADGLLLEDVNFIKSLKSHEVELLNYDSSYEEVYFKTASSYLNTIRNKPGKFCFTDFRRTYMNCTLIFLAINPCSQNCISAI